MRNPSLAPAPGDAVGALPSHWPRAVAWALVAATLVHAVVFIATVANPLVISDAWYFVDVFLRKYVDGQLTLGDFFAKRSAMDHALPFHKLLLLLNYRLFGVDLSVDAWIGFAFAVATLWLFRVALKRATPARDFADWPVQLAWVAMCAVYVSLNTSEIFEWPLLTLAFVALFCCFALYLAAWRALEGARAWPIVVAVFAVTLVSDGGGVIAVIAAALATGLYGLRTGETKPALRAIGAMVLACIAVKLVSWALAPPMQSIPMAGGPHAAAVSLPRLALAMTVPLSSGVLYPMQAQQVFHSFGHAVDMALRLGFIVAHAVFWWQAWRRRPTAAWFLAVATMLLFYGLCAGVLIGRVPQYGEAAFLQPRYIVFYQLHVVALLLMAVCWYVERRPSLDPANTKRVGGAMIAACLGLVLLQAPLDRQAWIRAPYQQAYVQRLAVQMEALADKPEVAPDKCMPQITVCRMPEPVRVRVVVFLRDHHLNVYSPAFRQRHGFEAD
ncbi:hypothetical protein LVB87_02290 [Lysobacter sp. KIS68-7]|uniref:hypothetical protein n=1 Tax=Lysobacter sp. KIS68-7 TaxID=2904252 RepID=UPI001E2C8F97|nr:hypothetical protein [Lysobacter sp. KIS68-7]UHQ20010.1 hypothetical protein LVB87_02290 [Lysobacter sp. KIS68-7]